jgi:hypothetical protein
MEAGVIVELISTLGFPIACVIALGYFVWKIYKRSETREDTLMQEIGAMREINAQAIETIAHYAEKLETIQEDVKEIKTDLNIILNK